jgi:hypothetical protein
MKILGPTIIAKEPIEPFFFLMGPILGGNGWQQKACLEIEKHVPDATIAVPCRWERDHPFYKYFIGSDTFTTEQLSWERKYLELAGEKASDGCIIVWLPCESKKNPRNDGQPYARDTYGELGEWRGRLIHNPNLRITIGAESEFPGIDVIRRNYAQALGRNDYPIHSTLEETISHAVRVTRNNVPHRGR